MGKKAKEKEIKKRRTRKHKVVEVEKAEKKITALVKKSPEDIIPDVSKLEKLSTYLFKSGMFPAVKNAHQALTMIEYGRELGIKPVQALQTMAVIKGKLCIESKAMLAMAVQKGLKFKALKHDEKICQIEFKRNGFEPHTETFTFEDARRAELAEKDNYKHWPKQMNFWRCVANGIRAYASDLALGLYTKEEIENAPTLEAQAIPGGMAEIAEMKEPGREEDKEKEGVVNDIKYKLLKLDIDVREFKRFLEEFQASGTKEPRLFVGYKFGNLSLGEGKLHDLRLLRQHFDYAINEFRGWVEKKEAAGEEALPEGFLESDTKEPRLDAKEEL